MISLGGSGPARRPGPVSARRTIARTAGDPGRTGAAARPRPPPARSSASSRCSDEVWRAPRLRAISVAHARQRFEAEPPARAHLPRQQRLAAAAAVDPALAQQAGRRAARASAARRARRPTPAARPAAAASRWPSARAAPWSALGGARSTGAAGGEHIDIDANNPGGRRQKTGLSADATARWITVMLPRSNNVREVPLMLKRRTVLGLLPLLVAGPPRLPPSRPSPKTSSRAASSSRKDRLPTQFSSSGAFVAAVRKAQVDKVWPIDEKKTGDDVDLVDRVHRVLRQAAQ